MKKVFLLCCLLSVCKLYAQNNHSYLEQIENHLYTNQDSCYYYVEKLYKEANTNQDWLTGFKGAVLAAISSDYAKDYTKMKTSLYNAEEYLHKLPKKIDTLEEGQTAYTIYYYHYKSHYYYELGNTPSAKKFYLKTLELIDQLPDSQIATDYADFITITNSYLALIYQREYKYDLAIEFYNENLRSHEKNKKEPSTIYETKNLIASLLSDTQDFEASNKLALEAIRFYKKDGIKNNPNSFYSTSLLLINNYIKTNQIDSAKYHLDKVKSITEDGSRFINDILTTEAAIKIQEGNFYDAIETYKTIIQSLHKKKSPPDKISEAYRFLGNTYRNSNQPEKAIQAYNTSLSFFIPQNNIDTIPRKAFRFHNLLATLKEQSLLYNHLGRYDQTLSNAVLATQKLMEFKKTFHNDNDKQKLIDNVLPIFEASIDAAYHTYQETKDSNYLDKAFTYFELSKSPILLDAIYQNNTTTYQGIPESIIEEERITKLEIKELEKSISRSYHPDKASKLFELKKEQDRFIKQIALEYPQYYDLKYSSETITLREFQKQISNDITVLSYFWGKDAVYVFSFDKNRKELFQIPISQEQTEVITALKKLISNPKSERNRITSTSYQIYQDLVKNHLASTTKQRLIIIPDGLLHTIPFEILSTDGTDQNILLKQFSTSYVNSATLWSKLQDAYDHDTMFAGFAPSFEPNETDEFQLSDLPNNIQEITTINTLFNGNTYKGDNATLANFQKEIDRSNHNIIHFATHAVTNDQTPEYSFLAFAKANKENTQLLYVNDLYLKTIHANLITLSACETGAGDIQKGEGVMSLSRAFFYSGAKSLIYSLWNINDYSSSKITTDFYKELSKGTSKDQALQTAKLAFINKNNENALAHPYYWSSLVVNGNTKSIVSKNSKWYYFIIPALLFLVLIGVLRKLFVKRF